MKKDPIPPDFDWVTARMNCSISKVFELLSLEAKLNVEMAQQQPRSSGRSPVTCEYVAFGGGFSIVQKVFGSTRAGVRLVADDRVITAEGLTGQTVATATLTVNDAGECRLLVGGQELDRWQFLKRVLEPVLFAPDPF